MERVESIRQLIYEGKLDDAIVSLDEWIAECPDCDEAYYLRGNAYRKRSDYRQALNNYLNALELNPDSPARQAHDMLIKILDFYNKDMYNH